MTTHTCPRATHSSSIVFGNVTNLILEALFPVCGDDSSIRQRKSSSHTSGSHRARNLAKLCPGPAAGAGGGVSIAWDWPNKAAPVPTLNSHMSSLPSTPTHGNYFPLQILALGDCGLFSRKPSQTAQSSELLPAWTAGPPSSSLVPHEAHGGTCLPQSN